MVEFNTILLNREHGGEFPVRVLLLVNSLLGAGAETSLRALQAPLREHRIDTRMATLTRLGVDGSDADALSDQRPGRREAVSLVRDALRRHRPDLVHTTLFESDLIGRIAARLEGVPAVTSLVSTPYAPAARDNEPVWAPKLWAVQRIDRGLARRATTAFHAISETVAAAAVRDLKVPRDRITVVPRGRDAAQLGEPTAERRSRARARLDVEPDIPLILAVGREEPQKNHITLLQAVARLRARVPNVVVAIAGRRGRASEQIDEAAHGLGMQPPTLLRLGPRDDVADLLVAADVFAFPSRWEGLGGAAIEAMALGTPIVAGDVPALRELLADGKAGLLADPDDPHVLAGALQRALDEPEAAAHRATIARERFQAHYTLKASAEGMAGFYRSVVEGA